ncbi:hypothetical protein P3342_007553 [Pyrenophora teres f. teres]|nr:hypothetical protein P3342_007553 [Pyrenophora teres f. teres]
MSQYNRSSTSSMDDTANAMLLQASLHLAFDRPRFVFVPKPSGNDDGMRLVLHLLEPSAEFAHLYHNRELHPTDVGVEMLFARFAWTLFPLLEPFLSCNQDRRLTVHTTSHDHILDRGYFTAAACERFSMSSNRMRPIQPSDDTNTSSFAPNLRKRSIGCIDHEPPTPCQTPGSNKRRKASSPTSPTECSTHSHDDAEESCIVVSHTSQLAQQWLEKERKRSDPEQTWKKDMLWLQEVWAGKSLDSHELPRFWSLVGYEVRDTGSNDLLAGDEPASDITYTKTQS